MRKTFHNDSFIEYATWIILDAEIFRRINDLLKDIERTGVSKAEKLKNRGVWARRIDEQNQLIYRVENDAIVIISCKGRHEK